MASSPGFLSAALAILVRDTRLPKKYFKLLPARVIGIDKDQIDLCQTNVSKNHRDLLEQGRLAFQPVLDPWDGYPQEAPYDLIVVERPTTAIPQALIDQLGGDGCLLIPIGEDDIQTFHLIRKDHQSGKTHSEELPIEVSYHYPLSRKRRATE